MKKGTTVIQNDLDRSGKLGFDIYPQPRASPTTSGRTLHQVRCHGQKRALLPLPRGDHTSKDGSWKRARPSPQGGELYPQKSELPPAA